MKKIAEIIADYSSILIEIDLQNLKESKKLKSKIFLSKECLHELRLYIRKNDFPSKESEIIFFKYQKPKIYGNLIYYATVLSFLTEIPKSISQSKKVFIKKAVRKNESFKKRNLDFYKYYKHDENSFDDKYFLRGNTQLELFSNTIHLDNDPEFSTSHDLNAAEVISYNLLSSFYSEALNKIEEQEMNSGIREVKPAILKDLSWTASKTDLTELLYALDASGALRNGKTEMKKLSNICQELFDIDLGNIYKTYGEIKMRGKDTTKFLDKLKVSLLQKINSEY